jgi:hypothetical protein
MDVLGFASHQLRRAADIVDRIEQLKGELASILESPTSKRGRKKRFMSDAGRLAIAAGQKARWAKSKMKGTSKRKMSAAARAKIALAAKARWAKAKAAGKNSL